MVLRRSAIAILIAAFASPVLQDCRLIPTREIRETKGGDSAPRGEARPNRGDNRTGKGPAGNRASNDKGAPGDGPVNGLRPGEPARPPLPGAQMGRLFFLMPTPFETTTGAADRREMLDLFSAPLMDRSLIIAAAGKLEKRTRVLLAARRTRACAFFRAAPAPKRPALLRYWRATSRNQLNAWRLSAARLDSAVDLHIRQARKSGSLLGDPSRSLKLVRRLRLERQQLVVRWWDSFFRELGPKPPKSCSPPPPGPKTVGTPTNQGPRERLFEPLALARYEFLRRLPGEFRLRLILTFHSPRNSDK